MVEPFINLAEVFVNGFVWKKRGSLEPGHSSLSRALRYCSRFVYLIGPESYIRARELDMIFAASSSLKFITIPAIYFGNDFFKY